MTITALAARCEVSRRILTDWEAGHRRPSPANAEMLARVLDFPIEFFSRPEPIESAPETASFRALSKMTAGERDRALAAAILAFEFTDWMEKRFVLPALDLPDLRGLDPEVAAQTLRARWGLGEQPLPNLIHLLEAKGVRIFSLADDTANVDAFSMWRGVAPFIFLNRRKSAERDRVDAAHELGHLVLHRDHREPRGRDREDEAEMFASAFLMPRASVLGAVPAQPTVAQLIALKRIWGVSVAALLFRLNRIGHLTEWRNRQLWIEVGRRGYRREEPNMMPRESSQLLAKVFAQLRAEGLSRADVARELRLHPDDLDALVFGLVPVPLTGGGTAGRPRRPNLRVLPGRSGGPVG